MQPGEEKAGGSFVYQYQMASNKDDKVRFLSVLSSDNIGSNGHKSKYQELKLFCHRVVTKHQNSLPREDEECQSLEIPKMQLDRVLSSW